jgi:hypothetical protein
MKGTTVLLWGDRWWIAGREEPVAFACFADAASVLAEALGDERPELTLVYQPETLRSEEVSCPNGRRKVLAEALGGDHPALLDPDRAWGFEPILALGEGFTTLVHYEEAPGLFFLVAQLAKRGLRVRGAWPLATFLHALPTQWSEGGGETVVAVAEHRALAYHHPSDGRRSVKAWGGPDAEPVARRWAEALRGKGEPVEVLDADSIGQVLARQVVLPQSHPAQLLPAPQLVTAQRALVAASVLLLLAGGWSGAVHARDWRTGVQERGADAHERRELAASLARYRANAAEIEGLRARIEASRPVPVIDWVQRISSTIPSSIALDRLRVENLDFRIEGHVRPGRSYDLASWEKALGDSRWKLAAGPIDEAGAFSVAGNFRR